MGGPQFQALPQPAPLPRLPRPTHQLEAEDDDMSPGMAPMSAPGGEPQPGAQLQVILVQFMAGMIFHGSNLLYEAATLAVPGNNSTSGLGNHVQV